MNSGKQDSGRASSPRERFSLVRRTSTLLSVIALHILAVLALLHGGSVLPGSNIGTLTVLSLTPPTSALPKPVPAARPEKPRPRTKDGERNAPDMAAATMPSTKGEACEPLETVALALRDDEAARAALDGLPPDGVGLANSIAVWTLSWNQAASPPTGPLLPVRAAIEAGLATLPQACLETPVAGPVILPFTTARRTNVLVFGSGQWSWAQLIARSPEAAPPDVPPEKLSIFEGIFEGL